MPTLPETFTALFERAVERYGSSTALRDDAGQLTYSELDRLSNRAAVSMSHLGVAHGDRVAVVLSNCREFLALWFGLAKIGAAHVAVNARLRGDALLYQLRHCEPSCLVMDAEVANGLSSDEKTCLPTVPMFVRGDCQDPTVPCLEQMLEGAGDDEPQRSILRPGDPLVVMYTSGTTGRPKGVVVPQYAYVRAAEDLADVMELSDEDVMYVCLPLYHGNPQVMGVSPTLWAGGCIALSARFSASSFWPEVAEYAATAFTHIGAVVPILLQAPPREAESENPLRIALGGAPRPAQDEFARRFDCEMLDGWGMIEAGCNTTVTPRKPRPLGQHGLPRNCFAVQIVDEDDRPVDVGHVGEIVVRPMVPNVMFLGYLNAPGLTMEKLGNLWFHSGDRGRLHADGSLDFLGRDEDAVRRGGENVATDVIEHELAAMPGVVEAVVVGVPDTIFGQELMACVVAIPDAGLDEERVARWVESRLGRSMTPRYVRLCGHLPKTASEKVQRYQLRALGVEGAWDMRANKSDEGDERERKEPECTPSVS